MVFSEVRFYADHRLTGPYYNCSTPISAEELAERSVFSSAPDPVHVAVQKNADRLLRMYNFGFLDSAE